LKAIKLVVLIVLAFGITQVQAYTALPTSLNLSSNTTNSTTGSYQLSWSVGNTLPPSSFSSAKREIQTSTLQTMQKSISQGGTQLTTTLYQNGISIGKFSESGSRSFSNKSNGTYEYYVSSCSWRCTTSNHVTVKVLLVNNTPTISFTLVKPINEDSAGNIYFNIGDFETPASSLTLSKSSSNTALIPTGNIVFGGSGTGRSIRVTPVSNKHGNSVITIKVSDGDKVASRSITVTVKPVNDAPIIGQGSSTNLSVTEDVVKSITLTATDIDSSTLTWSMYSNPSHGSTSISGTGSSKSMSYRPASNYHGSDSFRVRVSDGALTDIITVNVSTSSVNDAPIIGQGSSTNLTVVEDTPKGISLSATDADSSTLTWSMYSNPSHGSTSISGTGSSKSMSYRPASNYHGSDSFRVRVSDGALTDIITVNVSTSSVNDAPIIGQGSSTNLTVVEDTPKGISLSATDADSSTLTWSMYSNPSHGSTSISGTGSSKSMSYRPASNYHGSDSFRVRVSDGALTDIITVNVSTSSVNDAPIIGQGSSTNLTVVEDTPKGMSLSATDADSSTLTWSMYSNPSHGSTSISGTGSSKSMIYRPVTNYHGSDSFRVRVSDGALTDIITVNISVAAANDTPTISSISNKTIDEDNNTGNIAFVIGDMETSTNSLSLSKTSSNSTLIPIGNIVFGGSGANRTVRVTPAANKFGLSTITVTVSDGNKTRSSSFVINVTSVIDLPTLSEINRQVINEDENTERLSLKITNGDEQFYSISIQAISDNSNIASVQASYGSTNTISHLSFEIIKITKDIKADNPLSDDEWTVKVTPEADWSGDTSIRLIASGLTKFGELKQIAETNFTLIVNPVNDAPLITGLPDEIAFINKAYNFTPSAFDIDSSTLSFSIVGKPQWVNFNTTSGQLSGTPLKADIGISSNIVISVSDGELVTPLHAFAIEAYDKRQIIFIHTDILGTPVATTNKDGVIQ
jgi:VCBS repeat-containing protein